MNEVILIVDDSPTVCNDLLEAFTSAGLTATGCATLAEARVQLANRQISLLVLDVLLPDGDGLSLLEEIRNHPTHAHLPVLILSTEAEVRDRIRGLMTGSSDYIGKPYDRDHVVARTRQLIHHQQPPVLENQPYILVIDDSITFREALCDALREQQFLVSSAASGEEGLRSAAAHPPHLIIIDSVLPGIDGATVVRKLRLDAALRQTPCIMLTGSDDLHSEMTALNSGADAFARKEEELDLIIARAQALVRSSSIARDGDRASLLAPKKILAVDDSPTYLAELADTLREEGYDVIRARSGEEALQMVAVQLVDCILLDRLMPGLDGTETCRRIKSNPNLRDIPLIMLTGTEDRDAMIEGLATGADDYVLKSSEFDVLKARVCAQLRRKQFEDENRRIRMELLNKEMEAAEARAAHALAESRAQMLSIMEEQNRDLEAANEQLRTHQQAIAEKNRQLEEASRLKSEFLSTMSHELRTPLNAIIGFAELFKDGVLGELTASQNKYMCSILDSGEHLLQLINEVLDLSKIEAGKMQLDMELLELETMLSDSLSIIKERASVNQITLSWQPLGIPCQIQADRRRFRQIMYNLLSNAVKFTPPGGQVALKLALVDHEHAAHAIPGFQAGIRMPLPESDCQTFAQISVTDSGIGIDQADFNRLFKPFTQLDSSASRKAEGTGLGLAVVQQLVVLHGGTISMASEPGLGCCFTVWLPLRQDPVIEDTQPLSATSARQPVLVIEDDPHSAQLMILQLNECGFTTCSVGSAEAALALTDQVVPVLIILDLLLPGMGGWEFLSQIKGIAAWSTIPVVVVSMAADHKQGMALGASLVMQKPIHHKELATGLQALGFPIEHAAQTRVLVMDEDSNSLAMVSDYLRQAGYQAITTTDGQSGLDAAVRDKPDLIMLDFCMPEITGFDLVEALHTAPDRTDLPTIVLTAHSPDEVYWQRLNHHILQVIHNVDFSPRDFMGEVYRALRHTLATNQ
ncbi:response regulator [Chitinivorax sp. B]|uniref:response regulator n=1 Tax=Chitinivorax sp. B TaxID=2502235 RepID=UPI0010FA02D2|nr:response regulator [Chitinivorax sp. B]